MLKAGSRYGMECIPSSNYSHRCFRNTGLLQSLPERTARVACSISHKSVDRKALLIRTDCMCSDKETEILLMARTATVLYASVLKCRYKNNRF
jgi:hypothetical protein